MTTLQKYLDYSDGFIAHWEEFCKLTIPDVYKNNPWEIRVIGAAILNTAAKVWINFAQPLPANFFLALVGSPRSGKSSILRNVRAVIEPTWMHVIERGSPEAVIEQISKHKYGIFIWDEVEEVLKKAKSYMNTLSNKLNDMYYLDATTFLRTTKDPIILKRGDYFISTIFAGLPEQWKAIESEFLGGFERRFLTLKIKGKLPLYKSPAYNNTAAELLVKLQNFIECLSDYCFVLNPPDLSDFAEMVEREVWDELKQSVVQDYSYKLWVALQLNKLPFDKLVSLVSHNINNSSDLPMILNDTLDDTNDTNMMMILNKKPLRFLNDSIIDSMILTDLILKPLITSVKGIKVVEEPEMGELIRRIEILKSREVKYMRFIDFVTDIIGTRNADWYRPRIKALEDAGKIRIIQIKRKRFVVTVPDAQMCYNCKHFDLACKLDYPSREEREMIADSVNPIEDAKECEHFELI